MRRIRKKDWLIKEKGILEFAQLAKILKKRYPELVEDFWGRLMGEPELS